MDSGDGAIGVELAWSPRAGEVLRVTLRLAPGSTIADAIARSGWDVPQDLAYSVWGRLRDASHTLCDGDRLELLRPLAVDPKEARRQRATRRPARR